MKEEISFKHPLWGLGCHKLKSSKRFSLLVAVVKNFMMDGKKKK